MNLETIFRLVDLPKEIGRPPMGAKILRSFPQAGFVDCARFFNSQRIRGETATLLRKVYLSRETCGEILYFVEEKKSREAEQR